MFSKGCDFFEWYIYIYICINDVLVYSKTEVDHVGNLRIVLQRFKEERFMLTSLSKNFGLGRWSL